MGRGEVAAPDRLSVLLRCGVSSCLWCLEVCLFKRGYARLQTNKGPLVYTRNFWSLSPVGVNLMENFLFSFITMGIPWEIF